ncbi:MAG: hypothetical protein M1816_003665 [Peltula sp. TS41687]|nr:MAG: hypothetical protein M1816_003665 [Peltula sp. TS41687]
MPIKFGRFKLKTLSPINESPASQSMPLADSTAPTQAVSAAGDPVESHLRDGSQAITESRYHTGQSKDVFRTTTPPELNREFKMPVVGNAFVTKPARTLQRSKSDSYRLLGRGVDDIYYRRVVRPDLTIRSVSLYGEVPGHAPHKPLPSIPLNSRSSWRAETRTLSHDFSETRDAATPFTLVSANSSISNVARSPLRMRPDSDTLEAQPIPCSPTSSRTSGGVSIFDEDDGKWEPDPGAGLTSPSKKPRTQNSYATEQSNDSGGNNVEGRHLRTPNGGQLIQDGSRISLATVGREEGLHCPKKVTKEPEKRQGDRNPAGSAIDTVDKYDRSSQSGLSTSTNVATALSHRTDQKDRDMGEWPIQALRSISGNQTDPFQTRRQILPSSNQQDTLALVPHKPSSTPPKPVSVLKSSTTGGSGRLKGHRRQNCVRISNCPPLILGAGTCSPIYEEGKSSPSSTGSPRRIQSARYSNTSSRLILDASRRPPSRATFDPQISPTPQRRSFYQENYANGNGYMDMIQGTSMSSTTTQSRGSYQELDSGSAMLMLEHVLEGGDCGSPGPSILSSPISHLPRPPTFNPRLILPSAGLRTPPTPHAVQHGSPTRSSPSSYTGGSPIRRSHARSPSYLTPRPLSIFRGPRGPRTPPRRLSRSPHHRPTSIQQSMLNPRRMDPEAFTTNLNPSPEQNRRHPRTANLENHNQDERLLYHQTQRTTNSHAITTTTTTTTTSATAAGTKDNHHPSRGASVSGTSSPNRQASPMEKFAARNSRQFEMPNPLRGTTNAAGRRVVGLGLRFPGEELYDQDGFLI